MTATSTKSRSRRTPLARVLLEAERERFSCGAAIHCAHGRLGHRPVRHVPDCEVLAALVPERVLPLASGDSRKRGLSRAGPKARRSAAVGRRKASAPPPRGPGGLGPLQKGGREKGCAPHRFSMRPGPRLLALRLPSFPGRSFWRGRLARLFSVRQSSGAKGHRDNG